MKIPTTSLELGTDHWVFIEGKKGSDRLVEISDMKNHLLEAGIAAQTCYSTVTILHIVTIYII